jgi:Las17-binding protein actin regulator
MVQNHNDALFQRTEIELLKVFHQHDAKFRELILAVEKRSAVGRHLQHLLSSKFQISGEGSAAAGPVGRHASAGTDWKLNSELLTYSHSKGAFAGLTLEGAVIEQDSDSTTTERHSGLPSVGSATKTFFLLGNGYIEKEWDLRLRPEKKETPVVPPVFWEVRSHDETIRKGFHPERLTEDWLRRLIRKKLAVTYRQESARHQSAAIRRNDAAEF